MVDIFKRFWEKYFIEIIVSILGLVSALTTAVVDGAFSYNQAVIILITISVDIICLSNKNLLSENHENLKVELKTLNSLNDLYQLYNNMPENWKRIAREKIGKLREDLKQMASGTLILSGDSLVKYQAYILKKANKQVCAIHQALDEKSLKRWDKKQTTKDFTIILIKANKNIKPFVVKRRIFVVDEDLLKDEQVKKIWKKIIRAQKLEMGFKIRVISKQDCEKNARPIPKDMLICDDEVVSVHFYDGKARGEIYKEKERCEREKEYFEDCWEWGKK